MPGGTSKSGPEYRDCIYTFDGQEEIIVTLLGQSGVHVNVDNLYYVKIVSNATPQVKLQLWNVLLCTSE